MGRWWAGRGSLAQGWWVAGALVILAVHGARAGQAPAVEEAPVAVFHSYTNLIQVPVLVLNGRHQAVAEIPEARFGVTLNEGPVFPATHVRRQGGDPISLSILIDLTGPAAEWMPQVHDGLERLVPEGLHAKDHVSLYVLGCALTRFGDDVPAGGALFHSALDQALEKWKSEKFTKDCKPAAHLWDALGFIAKRMNSLPGRRVALVLSDGHDKGSQHTWNQVRLLNVWSSVAVFGLIPDRNGLGIRDGWVNSAYRTLDALQEKAPAILERASREDVFQLACELTGGVVLPTSKRKMGGDLDRFVKMVRDRYIVEFPRTDAATAGLTAFDVRIRGMERQPAELFIRPSGKSVPLPDPEELKDAGSQDPSKAPQLGKRKVLTVKPER